MRFCKNKLLLAVFSFIFIVLTSCDKDDDDKGNPSDNNNGGGDMGKGTYEMTVEGTINRDLTGDSAIFEDTTFEQNKAILIFDLLSVSDTHRLQGVIVKTEASLVETGTYDHVGQFEPFITGCNLHFYTGSEYYYTGADSLSEGSIEITERSDTTVKGTFHNMTIQEPSSQKKFIFNGDFHAEAGDVL